MRIGLKIASIVLSTLVLSSMICSSRSIYSNWSLYYTGSDVGSQLTRNYNPPVYRHYRFTTTSMYGSCTTKITCNGVIKYLNGVTTFDYYGTTSPSITLKLEGYTAGSPASMSGTMEVYN